MVDTVSVVVPVYNSQATLRPLVDRLEAALAPRSSSWELIFVNDGSVDGSWEEILALAEERSEVIGLDLMRNFGQHNALLCGIRAAHYDVIVTIDDDLQHPPEEIPKLLVVIDQGVDVAYGVPRVKRQGRRNGVTAITKFVMQKAFGVKQAFEISPFRAFKTRLREAFAVFESDYISIDVLLSWGASSYQSIPVDSAPRAQGRSGYSLAGLVRYATNVIIGFSETPLRIASFLGLGFSFFGGLVLCFVLVRFFLEGSEVPGFPFLASIISIFAGIQLFALGVIGEYVGRVHGSLLRKPSYVIKDRSEKPDGAP